ncbi:hypothetical protein P5673_013455 [Acropora cervicornis]|uniref:Uncharacterized protein n=1 Tax=Acropora cervicornis TaxID=6130 RepID=A0AAD9V6J2_ACRCE|nr:hypothetical protein P5673_013455 [Acropora cervicornis]
MSLWISNKEPVLTGVAGSKPGRFSVNFLHYREILQTREKKQVSLQDLENFLRNSISKSELKKGHTYGRESSEQRRSKRFDQYDPNMTPGPHLEFNFSLGFVSDRVSSSQSEPINGDNNRKQGLVAGALVRNGIKVRTTNGRFQVEVAHGDLLDSSIEKQSITLAERRDL